MTEFDTDAATGESIDESNADDPRERRFTKRERRSTERESSFDRWARRVWSAGSYENVAPKYRSMGGRLVERVGVSAGDEVLDVGCGTGTVAITAARRDARVTGVDITPELVDRARENADSAGVEGISWREGNATDLPFADDAFDVTLSNLGHVYGDPPDAAARELLRVTRPGGRIGFTSWTPTSPYPAMAGVVVPALSPEELPDFSEPPFLWGDRGTVRERLGAAVRELEFEAYTVDYPALSAEHFFDQTAAHSGIFIDVLEGLDEDDFPRIREGVIETIEPHFDERENAVELEYLLTRARVPNSE